MQTISRNEAAPASFISWLSKHPVHFPAELARKLSELEDREVEIYQRQVRLGDEIDAYRAKVQARAARIYAGQPNPGDVEAFGSGEQEDTDVRRKFFGPQRRLEAEADALKAEAAPFLRQASQIAADHIAAQVEAFNARLRQIYSDAGVSYDPDRQPLLWSIERFTGMATEALCSGLHGPGIVRKWFGAAVSLPQAKK